MSQDGSLQSNLQQAQQIEDRSYKLQKEKNLAIFSMAETREVKIVENRKRAPLTPEEAKMAQRESYRV